MDEVAEGSVDGAEFRLVLVFTVPFNADFAGITMGLSAAEVFEKVLDEVMGTDGFF